MGNDVSRATIGITNATMPSKVTVAIICSEVISAK
jgi:hypothetical protein